MDEPDLQKLIDRLLPKMHAELAALKASSAHTSADRKPVELDQQSVGRLSRMDAMQQQAMAAAQEARRHGRARALDAAIARAASGDFGWCADCGEFIGEKRLELDPTIMKCRDCAS